MLNAVFPHPFPHRAIMLAFLVSLVPSVPALLVAHQAAASKLEPRYIAACENSITQLVADPAGQTLFVSTDQGFLGAWDLKKQDFRWKYVNESNRVSFTGLSAGDKVVAATQGFPSAEYFDVRTGERKTGSLAANPNSISGAMCIACDLKGRWAWLGTKSGTAVRSLPSSSPGGGGCELKNGGATSMALDSDSKLLAVGGEDGTIRFVNASSASLDDAKIEAHKESVTALVWAEHDSVLISGSDDHTVRAWNVRTRKENFSVQTLPGAVKCIAVDAKSTLLAWGDDQGTVYVWDLSARKMLGELKDKETGPVGGVVFLDKGKSLAAATGGRKVAVWDLTKLAE